MVHYHHQSSIKTKIQAIESIIGQDDGGRGMKSLIVPNDLFHAAQHIVSTLQCSNSNNVNNISNNSNNNNNNNNEAISSRNMKNSTNSVTKHVVLLSGFPCCVSHNPPTETDGPPGTIAIAKCVLGLAKLQLHDCDYHVRIVSDECNHTVFQAAIDAHLSFENCSSSTKTKKSIDDDNDKDDEDGEDKRPMIELQTFPCEQQMTKDHYNQMDDIIRNKCDVLISCERAGPGKDGNCYTMRGINMSSMNLIAPLHYMVDKLREFNDKIYSQHSPSSSSSSSSSSLSTKKFIAIGDGGNELGMGKVINEIYNNPQILNGELIGAVTSADYVIAASVSNWGGYALAAACALVSYNAKGIVEFEDDDLAYWIDQCVPSKEHEIHLLNCCVDAGCRDGVSGEMEATVDGMPLEKSLDCLQRVIDACLEMKD